MKVYCPNTKCEFSGEDNYCTLEKIQLIAPYNYPIIQSYEWKEKNLNCWSFRPKEIETGYDYTFYWKDGRTEKVKAPSVGFALCENDYDSGDIPDLDYWIGGRENEWVSEDIFTKRRNK